MANALFSFDDRDSGRRAADDLIRSDLPAQAVRVHAHATPDDAADGGVDELITGGLVGNLSGLFQGLFEWGASPHDAAAFERTVSRGGAVIGIDAESAEEQAKVDQHMQAAGCVQRTDWSSAPISGFSR